MNNSRVNIETAQKLLKVVSRTGIVEILVNLENGPKKFSQLMFDTQLNPGILDRHLKALLNVGLVEKDSENYVLTKTGKIVLDKLAELVAAYENVF